MVLEECDGDAVGSLLYGTQSGRVDVPSSLFPGSLPSPDE